MMTYKTKNIDNVKALTFSDEIVDNNFYLPENVIIILGIIIISLLVVVLLIG